MKLSEMKRSGQRDNLVMVSAGRSPVRQAMYAYLLRVELREDLPTFYSQMHTEAGISERIAQRMVFVVKRGSDEALDALDALPHAASLDQCVFVAQQPKATQQQIARELVGAKRCNAVLAAYREEPKSEATFQGETIIEIQRRYAKRVYLERRNVGRVVTRDRSGARTGVFSASRSVGAADYFGVLAGRHFEIEFKAEGGKQRKGQEHFEARMRELGVPYFLWSAADGVDACLDQFASEFGE